MTTDTSTYTGAVPAGADHPIAWCHRFDGGRSWYNGMGHTQASFSESGFLSQILAGINITAGYTPSAACGIAPGNRPPTVTVSRNPAGNAAVNAAVGFTATASDPDGDTLTYAWDFGDGGTSTAQNPTHVYTDAGTYAAKVTVSDGNGGTADATSSVTVVGATQQETNRSGRCDGHCALRAGDLTGAERLAGRRDAGYHEGLHGLRVRPDHEHGRERGADRVRSELDGHRPAGQRRVRAGPAAPGAGERPDPAAGAFGPVGGSASPLTILSIDSAVSVDPITIGLKQSVGANELLRAGSYSKTLTFTLTSTTP